MTAITMSPVERLRALAAQQLERDGWSRERLVAHQQARLQTLLEHAAACSPYYREVLQRRRPLAEQPVLTKATLMEHWDRIVCDDRLTLAAAQAHATGPDAAAWLRGEFQVFSTSGASGQRGLFVYSAADWATSIAATLRAIARCGVRPGMRMVGIGAPGGVHMSKRIYATMQQTGADAPTLSAMTPLDEMVATLNDYQPQVLMGYSSVGALLAGEQLAGRLAIAPEFLAFGSEPLTVEMRAKIEAAWGMDPSEYYASTEVPVIASSTPQHPRALELYEDLAVVEVVDADNRPVPPGTAGAKLLLTNLENRTLPLIRYELPDRVTLSPAANPAGRPFLHLSAIDGRTADTLTFPRRGGGEVAVIPLRLGAPFAGMPAVRQFQIVHEAGRLEIRVVLEHDAPADLRDQVRAAIVRELDEAGAVLPAVDVVEVAELEREPGAAAKLKLIVAR